MTARDVSVSTLWAVIDRPDSWIILMIWVCVLAVESANAQAGQQRKPLMVEDVFKNVQILKGIPVDEFMDTMGFFAAALRRTTASIPKNMHGKFEGVGNGGLGGTISYTNLPNYLDHASLADAIMSGYAGASTDTGHISSDRTWLANEEKEKDYGYRAIHEMTVTAKAVIQKFYGRAATRSYFNGCSTGGGQALGEAQLYPEDYDGILAGDSQNILTHSRASDIWAFQSVNNENKLSASVLSHVKTTVHKVPACSDPHDDVFLDWAQAAPRSTS